MNTIHINFCPVCSNNNCENFLSCTDYMVTQEVYSLYKCAKCKFIFTQNFPVEDEIGKYYEAPEYVSHSDTQKGLINTLYHFARKITLRYKVNLVNKYAKQKSGKLLDIGSGTGYFLNAISKNKWDVKGIEKSEEARKLSRDKFGLDIQDSDSLFEIPSNSLDVITLWHVLEHIEKLNPTMENLHRILKDKGILFVALPNANSYDAAHYKQNWAAYDVPRHLWHFSPNSFSEFAKKHNFKVHKMNRMNFDPFYISMLSEKYKGSHFANLKGFLLGFTYFARSLFNTKRSSSIIYILKKNKTTYV